MSALDLGALEALVRSAAQEELQPRFRHSTRQEKADGSWVTEADLAMQNRLKSSLTLRHPEIAFLGEEMTAAVQERLLAASNNDHTGLWILDPLDGTNNFAAGIPLYSVSLALLQGGRISAGIVYDPSQDESFAALCGSGATLNGQPLQTTPSDIPLAKTTACIDFKRLPPALASRIASNPPYSSQRSIGSVALDWCWVAAGRFHVYLHGRQNLWDYAAGSLILAEAGGFADTLDGETAPLSLRPRSAICAADPQHFAAWCNWLRQAAPPVST